MEALSSQIVLGAIWSYLIEQAKCSKYFPWVSAHTDHLNRLAAIFFSGITTLGITFSSNATWAAGGTVTISLPSGDLILLGLWHWLQSFVLQQITYHAAIKTKTVTISNEAKGLIIENANLRSSLPDHFSQRP